MISFSFNKFYIILCTLENIGIIGFNGSVHKCCTIITTAKVRSLITTLYFGMHNSHMFSKRFYFIVRSWTTTYSTSNRKICLTFMRKLKMDEVLFQVKLFNCTQRAFKKIHRHCAHNKMLKLRKNV